MVMTPVTTMLPVIPVPLIKEIFTSLPNMTAIRVVDLVSTLGGVQLLNLFHC